MNGREKVVGSKDYKEDKELIFDSKRSRLSIQGRITMAFVSQKTYNGVRDSI